MDPRCALHVEWQHTDYLTITGLPVTAFVGVDAQGASLLAQLGVRSVFDLANASVFMAAELLVLASQDASHPFRKLGRVSADLVDGTGTQLPVEQWPLQPLRLIAGIGPALGPELERRFDLHTISELACFGPYQVAKEMVRLAAGGGVEPLAEVGATPDDLLPRNGQYPTDRVYYRSLLLRSMEDQDGGQELDQSSGLDLSRIATAPATGAGYGAYVTWEQVWYGQGLVLGNLLHSLALAPGEATMIAIVDWTRSVSTSAVESVDQLDSLEASTSQNRALSEVTYGVASEVQNGFSTTTAASSTQSMGATAGTAGSASMTIPIPGMPLDVSAGGGFGGSYGTASTVATSMTVASTSGTRETFAEYGQNISEATQQRATSARSRRASIVQEVRESTSETLQTRVVANYNHMHAMSVCYYEIVQIFRVVLQAARVEKCSFVPIMPLDFSDDTVIDRFAPILRQVSRDPYLTKVLATSIRAYLVAPVSGAIYFRLPSMQLGEVALPTGWRERFRTSRSSLRAAAPRTTRVASPRTRATSTELPPLEDAPFDYPTSTLPVEIPGPLQVAPNAHFTTVSAKAGSNALPITVTWIDGLAQSYMATDVDWPLLDVESLVINIAESLQASEVTLELGVTTGTIKQSYRITLPTIEGINENGLIRLTALVVVGSEVSATDLALARAHLIAEAAWYTARIWERIDITTISALLAQYRFRGKPLLSVIDPRLLAVTGTHAVFRMLLDDADKAEWLLELERWGLTGPSSRREDLVPLPTGGVFAEAVLGRSNSAEKLDVTRFWNWQDSPPPFAPPGISSLQAGLQPTTTPPTPGSLDAPIINMVQPNVLPSPTGLSATLGLLQASNMFRDMSYAAQNAEAAGAAGLASSAAQAAALNAAQQAFATAAALATSASLTGALMNAAQDGVPGAMERLVPPPPIVAAAPPPPQGGETPPPSGGGITGTLPPQPQEGETPPPSGGGDTDIPPPPPPPEDELECALSLALSVPYSSVRLDFANAAWSAIPADVRAVFGQGLTLMGTWVYAIGFDDEGGFDVIKEALEAFAIAVPGIGEIVVAVEGLKAVIDFVGLDPDVSSATAQLGIDLAANVMNTLQSLVFPTLKGDDWLSATIKVEVTDGVPTATIDRWVPKGIPYGFLTMSEQAEGGPWWSGDSWSALMFSTTFISRDSLTTSAQLDTDGALLVNLKLSAPLQLSWAGVLAQQTSKLAAQVASLMSDAGVAAGVAAALGVSDAELELVARIKGAFEWMRTNIVAVLERYFTPHIDMDLMVRIEESGNDWQLTVSGTHDSFPSYVLSLNGPDGAVEDLYAGPEALKSSAEGPAALILPYSSSTGDPMTTVPSEWMANLRRSPPG